MPFWPVWLESRGLPPEWIGVALGLPAWARLIVNPALGSFVDRTGRTRGIAVVLAFGVLLTYVAFSASHGTVMLLALSVVLGIAYAPLVPLIDATAVGAATRGVLDYGRVRRWGSLAFIVASIGVGWMLEGADDESILVVLLVASVVLIAAMTLLPRPEPKPEKPSGLGVRVLLRRPEFRLFLLTAALLHGSHAVLYAYGTPHWRAAGISDSTIGALWAEGVVAEIALFSVAPRIAARISPAALLVLAGVAGMIRWPLLAMTVAVPWLAAAQLLHALTFAATHLGAMNLIREHVEDEATSSATALYSGVGTGLAFGVGLPLAGLIYKEVAGEAYWVTAGLSTLGVVSALVLRRRLRNRAQRPAS